MSRIGRACLTLSKIDLLTSQLLPCPSVVSLIRRVLVLDEGEAAGTDTTAKAAQSPKRRRGSSEGSYDTRGAQQGDNEARSSPVSSRQPNVRRHSMLIEAFLHPNNVEAILEGAPSDSIAEAWRKGEKVLELRHRLRICEHDGYNE